MKAAVFQEVGHPLAIQDVPDPTPGEMELVLRVKCCGICGTDLHASSTQGGVPDGCVMGHEFAGEIVEVGKGVPDHFEVGQHATSVPAMGCGRCGDCLSGDVMNCSKIKIIGLGREPGAFAEYVRVGSYETLRLPDSLPWDLGALVEPLAVGLHAVKVADLKPGQNALVLGGGPIGLAVSLWLRFFGLRSVVVSEPTEARRSLAIQLGATGTVLGGDDLAEEFYAHAGGPPDVVFECVGLPGLLGQCIELARPRSKIIVMGLCMAPETIVPAVALAKELNLQFVLAYHKKDFSFTIDLLASGRLNPEAMVTHRVGLGGLPAAFEALRNPTTQCKVLVEV